MYFVLSAVVLSAFAKIAGATPFTSTSITAQPIDQGKSFSNVSVQSLDGPAISSTTSAYTASSKDVHSLSTDSEYPATLYLCAETDCSNCYGFGLVNIRRNACLTDDSSAFVSMYIDQPSNEGLPFGVFVGPSGCSAFWQIPKVDVCYNAINGPFTDFEVTE